MLTIILKIPDPQRRQSIVPFEPLEIAFAMNQNFLVVALSGTLGTGLSTYPEGVTT